MGEKLALGVCFVTGILSLLGLCGVFSGDSETAGLGVVGLIGIGLGILTGLAIAVLCGGN